MNEIKTISNKIFSSAENKIEITPDYYFEEFKKYARRLKVDNVKEIQLFENVLKELTKEELTHIKISTPSDLIYVLSQRVNQDRVKELLSIFDDILSPSINFREKDSIDKFISNLSKEPTSLFKKDKIRRLQSIAKERVKLDRVVLKEKTKDIVKLTSLIEKYFENTILEGHDSQKEISKIKEELVELNISTFSQREIGVLQNKLIDTVFNIENSIQRNLESLNKNRAEFEKLNKTIEKLQEELSQVKKEKNTDFLTSILNRRAYEEEVEKIEKKYSVFNRNYAIVFIDIDHFKQINDTYGHICGDFILKTFAKVLKNLTRQEDILARYGGEEFITLINYHDPKEVVNYISRLKKIIATSNFVFENIRIQLRFSAGVTYRSNHDSYLHAKELSDQLLHKAKKEGRDKIIFENGVEV